MDPLCPAEDVGHDQPLGRVACTGALTSRSGTGVTAVAKQTYLLTILSR